MFGNQNSILGAHLQVGGETPDPLKFSFDLHTRAMAHMPSPHMSCRHTQNNNFFKTKNKATT